MSPDDRSELVLRTQLMQRMIRLALETDSTRIVALVVDENANPKVNLPGVQAGHHSLPHHGQRADSVEQLKIIETAQMKTFGELLGSLKNLREKDETLLDRTNNEPLPNLFVSMLQRMGIETDRFASSSGTLRGLEWS